MITHSTVVWLMSKSVWIDGIATLTIATSRIVMKNAVPTTARMIQRRGFGSAAMSRSGGEFVKVPPQVFDAEKRPPGGGYSGFSKVTQTVGRWQAAATRAARRGR